jgi:hypothetical protein
MAKQSLDWKLIFAAGQVAGANYEAVKKWKQRNIVPYKYRYPIVQITKCAVKMTDFDDMAVSKKVRAPKKVK